MLAQTTQPIPDGAPAWAVGLCAVLGALVPVIAGLAVLLPLLRDLIKQVGEAKESAATAIAATEATQQSVTRVSNRTNALTGHVVTLAERLDPRADPVVIPDRPKEPPGGVSTE